MTAKEILSARITDTLMLKIMNEKDWRSYICALTEADEIPVMYGVEPTAEFLGKLQKFNPDAFAYSINYHETKGQVGYVALNAVTGGIECYIYPEYRKKGIASDALRLFVKMCLDGTVSGMPIKKLSVTVYCENEATEKLLSKTGFIKEEGTAPTKYVLK